MKKSAFILTGMLLASAFSMGAEHLKSINGQGLNPNVKPGEDFYLYVNKDWINKNPLTPE